MRWGPSAAACLRHARPPTTQPEILAHLRRLERELAPRQWSQWQTDITPRNRLSVLDWLIEVHTMWELGPDTLYLAINVLDRFLSAEQVARGQLQLAGITSLMVAAKYDAMDTPDEKDFVWLCDGAYTMAELLAKEHTVLEALGHRLGCPSPRMFLHLFAEAVSPPPSPHLVRCAEYLLELAAFATALVGSTASLLAAAALFTALRCFDRSWAPELRRITGLDEQALVPIAAGIVDSLAYVCSRQQVGRHQAIRKRHPTTVIDAPELARLLAL